MIVLDLIINNLDLSIQGIQKVQSKYTSMKKTEKRKCFTFYKINNLSNDEQLLKLGGQYNSYSARYDNTVR